MAETKHQRAYARKLARLAAGNTDGPRLTANPAKATHFFDPRSRKSDFGQKCLRLLTS